MEFDGIALRSTQWPLMLTIFPKIISTKIQFLRNLNFSFSESYWNQIFAIFLKMMANIHIGESVQRVHKCENKFSIEPYEKWQFFHIISLKERNNVLILG